MNQRSFFDRPIPGPDELREQLRAELGSRADDLTPSQIEEFEELMLLSHHLLAVRSRLRSLEAGEPDEKGTVAPGAPGSFEP